MRCSIAMMLLCAAGLSSAQTTAPMAIAWRHYRALEYDQALASLVDARRAATTPAQLSDVLLLEACVQVALDRNDEAIVSFRNALRNNPAQKLAPNSSPKLTTVYDQAKTLERERAQRRSELALRLVAPSTPEVARRAIEVVAIVDRPFEGLTGRVQVENTRSHGLSEVALVKEPDGVWRARIPTALVDPGATLALRASLLHENEVIVTAPALSQPALLVTAPAYATALRVDSAMTGAEVRIDGVLIGRVPIERPIPSVVGVRRVELSSSRGSIIQSVDLAEGEIVRVSLKVEPRARLPIARYFLIGVGSALVIAGGVLFDQSARADARYRSLVALDPVTGLPTTAYSTASPQESSARSFQLAASVFVAVGGAAAIVGLALFAVRGEQRNRSRVAMTSHGLGISF